MVKVVYQKVDFLLGVRDLVSSYSCDYQCMIHSTKYRSSSLVYTRSEDQFSTDGDSRCGVGHSTKRFSFQKAFSVTERNYMGFRSYQCHHTASSIELYWIMDYPFDSSGDYSFGDNASDGKLVWVLVPPTFTPRKLIVVLMVVILCNI